MSSFDPTFVIGEDTDLLVILCHHANCAVNAKHKLWDIGSLCHLLGKNTCSYLPFVHAVVGCDTISCLYGIGKRLLLKNIGNPIFNEQASVFCPESRLSQSEIVKAGTKTLVCFYGGKSDET